MRRQPIVHDPSARNRDQVRERMLASVPLTQRRPRLAGWPPPYWKAAIEPTTGAPDRNAQSSTPGYYGHDARH
jgi:hypothetical protein